MPLTVIIAPVWATLPALELPSPQLMLALADVTPQPGLRAATGPENASPSVPEIPEPVLVAEPAETSTATESERDARATRDERRLVISAP